MQNLSRANCLVIFCGVVMVWVAAERIVNAQPLLVQLEAERSVFYRDEGVRYSVFYDSTQSRLPGCNFGFSGQTVQLLRNGRIIHEETLGPVSMTIAKRISDRNYASFGGAMPFQFPDKDIDVKDDYQLRVTCGNHVSPPTKAFHIDPWSEPVDGLQVLIRPFKTEFKVGEPIRVEVTMRNRGSRPRLCPVPLDDGRPLNFWKLQPHWLDSRPYPDEDEMYERSLKVLKPGESRRATLTLNHFRGTGVNQGLMFGSREGTYQVWFSVFFEQEEEDVPAKYRTNLWRADLSTNIIELVVRK